jgi:hypothetical protein
MARILRGDIIWADLNPTIGHEQAGKRPVLVLSHEVFNKRSGTVIAVAITSQPQKAGFPITLELQELTLQRQSAQSSHFFNLPFSMRLISKVIPVLNPSHHFQRFIHVESPQGQNHLQENPKLRERNGWSFFSPILFSNAREKNEPACTSTCGGSILQIFLLRTDPSLTRSWSPRSIAL